MRVATFIHLSDLHFGEPHPEYYSLLRSLSGFYNDNWGHDQYTCEVLEKFIDQRRNEQVGFIITGDLTNYGHPSQFKLITDYLSLSPTADRVCLGLTDWKENTISGNHDCWPGRPFPFIQGSRTLACRATFRQHPYWNKIVELRSGHRLHFIGIDTDSDVSFGDKLCARGAFETQLQTLATQLPPPEENDEVRILLLHHSCLPAPGKIGHEIKRRSQEALDKFLLKHRIAVLLSGHLHEPCIKTVKLPARNSETNVSVLEARCGTTTQRTGKPILRQMGPSRRLLPTKLSKNTLLLHEIHYNEEGKQLEWSVVTFAVTNGDFKGYTEIQELRNRHDYSDTIQVYPKQWPASFTKHSSAS